MNEKCQVFTPENYVEKLLDSVGYIDNLCGKKIMENSCGDGNILGSVVKRYISICKENGLDNASIKRGLERDIYGIEIDIRHFTKCIENLNIITEAEGIEKVKWKIYNQDYLKYSNKIKFDYIVGNPPYVTYSEINEGDRQYVKDNYETCSEGKFDYCYAFIEKSLLSLKKDGRMAYLIPSSIFKTVFGKKLRQLMKKYIFEIVDYTEEKIFDNALVKSAIMVLTNNRRTSKFIYSDVANNVKMYIDVNDLKEKWFFTELDNCGSRKFGDYFQVSHVVATLLNNAFVIKEWKEQDDYIISQNTQIEKAVVRETATPRSLKYNKNELIIFPYQYIDGKIIKYSVDVFEKDFPGATKYLNNFIKELNARKKDQSAKWFEYGRSQALNGLDCKKLLISTVISDEVNVRPLEREVIPYGGMYIVPKTNEITLEECIKILKSEKFMDYVKHVGIHISGNSLRITSKDIMDFCF